MIIMNFFFGQKDSLKSYKTAFFNVYYAISSSIFVVVVVLLFYVHGKYLRSCRNGQLT